MESIFTLLLGPPVLFILIKMKLTKLKGLSYEPQLCSILTESRFAGAVDLLRFAGAAAVRCSVCARFAAAVLWSSTHRGLAAGHGFVDAGRCSVDVGRGSVAAGPGCWSLKHGLVAACCCGSFADEDENKEERYQRFEGQWVWFWDIKCWR
ncbi:hypothetical protein RIF29_19732 [Crotalaria pallida]|uniref:Uncharacterized protein n=1 Tax=Crotalaria pallida TaxID=3830 RepID=A0AAN9I4E4_CROPI